MVGEDLSECGRELWPPEVAAMPRLHKQLLAENAGPPLLKILIFQGKLDTDLGLYMKSFHTEINC